MRGPLALLVIGLTLIVGRGAQAQTAPAKIDEVQVSGPARSAAARPTDAGQISAATTSGAVSAGQIAAAPGAGSLAPSQLTAPTHSTESSSPVSRLNQGRNVSVTAIAGHDRCDPVAGQQADRSGCDRIIENRADEFSTPAPPPPATVVNTDAPAPDIVNDIVNGGTGTVVTLPKP